MMKLQLIPCALVLALVAGCASTNSRVPVATKAPEDKKLERFFDDYLDFLFRVSPTTATALGARDHDAELDDLSREALDERAAGLEAFRYRLLSEVDHSRLSASGKADHDILRNELASSLFSLTEIKPYERDPLAYSSLISGAVYDLLKREPDEARVRAAISRMKKMPRLLDQARANLQDPPRPHVEVAIRQNQGAIGFYDGGIADLVRGLPAEAEALAQGKSLAEALRAYQKWLEEDLLPRAKGEWKIGRPLWEQKLKYSLDSSLGAAEIQQRARSEYDRVRGEMHKVALILWPVYFPGVSPPTGDDASGKTIRAVIDKVADEHSTRESIVGDAKKVIDELQTFIRRKDILALPDPDRLNVIVMPEFQAGVSTAYLDPAPPLDPEGKSFYAIEPMPKSWSEEEVNSRLREYNTQMLKILSIHEGYPGHYVQLEYSNRFPSKIRRILGNGPMIEGWAVYTELMMVESGFGDFDPKLKLNQLKFYLRAVINALIDQGLHCGEMTDEEALALMIEGGFQESNEAKSKLVRAKVTSTQLSTYFVGFQEVISLRREMQERQERSFSLKEFHERFLSQGSPPVRVIREAMLGAR